VADDGDGQQRGLSGLILRAGALAAALAAIVGLVTLVWPDSPARLAASLERLAVDTDVSLSEFSARQRVADARESTGDDGLALGPAARQALVLIADHDRARAIRIAQSPDDPAAPEAPEGRPGSGEGGETSPAEPEDGEAPSTLAPGTSEQGSDAETLTRVKNKLPPETLPGGCAYRGSQVVCEARDQNVLRSLLPAPDVAEARDGGAVADAEALVAVLENSRARPVSSGGTEPLGVTLSFDLTLEGYADRRAEVRWSLYDAGARKRVPREWLVNRRAHVVRPEAAFDRSSAEFWVPLPRRRGPFFVRLSVFDDQGERLAFADSEAFR
jgi:hypothetical protein